MPDRRRLTVSLVVTGAVAAEIDGLRRALGRVLQRIAPHLTLVPPLNIKSERLLEVLDHVRLAAHASASDSRGAGTAGHVLARAPVLYLEVRGETEEMARLRNALVTGPLAPPHTGAKERDFVPHLTLDQRIEPGPPAQRSRGPGLLPPELLLRAAHGLEQDAAHRGRWRPRRSAGRLWWGGAVWTWSSLSSSVPTRLSRRGPTGCGPATGRSATAEVSGPHRPFAIVARAGGETVGFADGEANGLVMRLGRLIVSPPWRQQGVGSHLLRAVERLALDYGCDRVRLEVLAGEGPEWFYAERGFTGPRRGCRPGTRSVTSS